MHFYNFWVIDDLENYPWPFGKGHTQVVVILGLKSRSLSAIDSGHTQLSSLPLDVIQTVLSKHIKVESSKTN